jgi:uncharacterized protein
VIDLAAVDAIDVHVHAELARSGADAMPSRFREAAKAYFKSDTPLPNVDEVAAYYRERKLAAVVFTVDFELHGGGPPISNDEIAAAAFWPNEHHAYPLYEAIASAGLPALFHSGHSGIGTGLPGGGGLKLKYSNPMALDDVAADIPDLKIVLAHPSFPWQDEAISICLHKANVWIDLSGWSPKYFPPQLVQYANTQLREKVLFGSDFPLITPDRWLHDFAEAPFKDEVRPLVLKENAVKLLGL